MVEKLDHVVVFSFLIALAVMAWMLALRYIGHKANLPALTSFAGGQA